MPNEEERAEMMRSQMAGSERTGYAFAKEVAKQLSELEQAVVANETNITTNSGLVSQLLADVEEIKGLLGL